MSKKKILAFDANGFKHQFTERSACKVMFARVRLEYLQSVEKYIRAACEIKKIDYIADYEASTMEVATTNETRDPYIIVKANDMIQLLSKGVPLEIAVQVLEDEIFSEIVPVNLICSSEKTFERRRNRLSNPKVLKAIELLTKSFVFISGKVVCIIGNYKGFNDAKNMVIACFENIHPAFEIKKLIIKKKLEKEGVEGDWTRYLPKIEKTHQKKIKAEPTDACLDSSKNVSMGLSKETGEYYADPKNAEREMALERARKQREERRKLKMDKYVVPDE